MKISKKSRQMLIDEIDYVVGNMNEANSAEQKLYYFSGIFGILNRLYNIEFDEDLVFAHFIIQSTHQEFIARLQAIKREGDATIMLADWQFDKLTSYSKELGEKLKKNDEIVSVLKKILLLKFSTTGNGFYLLQKGAYAF